MKNISIYFIVSLFFINTTTYSMQPATLKRVLVSYKIQKNSIWNSVFSHLGQLLNEKKKTIVHINLTGAGTSPQEKKILLQQTPAIKEKTTANAAECPKSIVCRK